MSELTDNNNFKDSANVATAPATTPANIAPQTAYGGDQQAFVPAGAYATGVGERRVLWPVAIGAISVALGILKLLGLVGQMLHTAAQLPLGGGARMGAIFNNSSWAIYTTSYLFAGIIGGLLLPAGLLLWRQSRLGPRMHIIYAILAILPNILWNIGVALFYPHLLGGPATQGLVSSISSLWSATTVMIYPVFLLIWFTRPNVKAETRVWR